MAKPDVSILREIRVEPTKIDALCDTIKSPKTIRLITTKSVETND